MGKRVRLGDIEGLEFISGQITKRIEPKESEETVCVAKVVLPKAIELGRINHSELISVNCKKELSDKNLAKKVTKKGDIVIKLSSPFDAAYISEEEEGLLVSSFCIILRNDENSILTNYLLAFFNSKFFLDQVYEKFTGSATPMANIKIIKDVMINFYDDDKKQQEIADYYLKMTEKEKMMKTIVSLEKKKLDLLLGG